MQCTSLIASGPPKEKRALKEAALDRNTHGQASNAQRFLDHKKIKTNFVLISASKTLFLINEKL